MKRVAALEIMSGCYSIEQLQNIINDIKEELEDFSNLPEIWQVEQDSNGDALVNRAGDNFVSRFILSER